MHTQSILSFEEAQKIDANGFIKPTPHIGQFWYSPNGRLYMIDSVRGADIFARWHQSASWSNYSVIYEQEYKDWLYAATATDLLKMDSSIGLKYLETFNCWACFLTDTDEVVSTDSYNPASAVAKGHLSQKNKKHN